MFYVYILYSKKHNRTYTGFTKDLVKRLNQHNSGYNRSTKPFIPWEIIYSEQYTTKSEAISREKFLKSSTGRMFIKQTLFNKKE